MSVERLEFIASDFGIVHAFEQRVDAGVFLAPEVVCDWDECQDVFLRAMGLVYSQESDTLGAISDPAIAPGRVVQSDW